MIYALIEARRCIGRDRNIAVDCIAPLSRCVTYSRSAYGAALATSNMCVDRLRAQLCHIIAFRSARRRRRFKIYYITAWRKGETDFLQSALTRACLQRRPNRHSLWHLGLSAIPSVEHGQTIALSSPAPHVGCIVPAASWAGAHEDSKITRTT